MSVTGEARLRVRYAETDAAGVVYHANFVIWLEVGRVELMRQLGFSYAELEKQHGCHIAVVEVRVRYKMPARYDDEILVRTRLTNMRGSLMQFTYEIVRAGDNALLAEAESSHIVVGQNFERTALPEAYAEGFRAAMR